MKQIRTKEEFYCNRCGEPADTVINFENTKVVLCSKHEEEFKKEIKEKHLD